MKEKLTKESFMDKLNTRKVEVFNEVPIEDLSFDFDEETNKLKTSIADSTHFSLSKSGFKSLCEKMKINRTFASGIEPELLISNLNYLKSKSNKVVNVMCIDNEITGLYSKRVTPINIQSIVPALTRDFDIEQVLYDKDEIVLNMKQTSQNQFDFNGITEIYKFNPIIHLSQTWQHSIFFNLQLLREVCTNGMMLTDKIFNPLSITSKMSKVLDGNTINDMVKALSSNNFNDILGSAFINMSNKELDNDSLEQIGNTVQSFVDRDIFSLTWATKKIENNLIKRNWYETFNIITEIGRDLEEIKEYDMSLKYKIKGGKMLSYFSNSNTKQERDLISLIK